MCMIGRLLFVSTLIVVPSALGIAQDTLVPVRNGVLPNDTSGPVRMELAAHPRLSGRCLKVVYLKGGSSFGQSYTRVQDWTQATQFQVEVWNPLGAVIDVTWTLRHAGSTSFAKRIDKPIQLKSGSNTIAFALTRLKNNDGSRPDLSHVKHWYIACSRPVTTLYFGDFQLAKGKNSPVPSGASNVTGCLLKPGATLPDFKRSLLFNTAAADRIMSAIQMFPKNNPWNEDISERPVHPNSRAMIATAQPNRHLYFNSDMGFVIVPPNQPRVDVKVVAYPDESDPGPFPIPDNAPIEGWPLTGGLLATYQRAVGGDRHLIVLEPGRGRLYEFFNARRTDSGWQAAQASTFDVTTNALRPQGWTSADAAGLPILPAVIRYDELQRGMVEHAMRVTVRRTRRAYIYPATHFASRDSNPQLLRMGERLRLRRDFDESGFPSHARAVLKGLKKYGMLVADNGVNWCLSVAPDRRIRGLESLKRVKGRDFEVIIPTGPESGPRGARQSTR